VPEDFKSERAFKNFHRSLCARFGYPHDERDWWRDLVSLEEFLAAKVNPVPEGFALVPKDPTPKMNQAGARWLTGIQHMRAGDKRSALDEAFKAMISAAPSPEAQS
jgi:hypothetical protein